MNEFLILSQKEEMAHHKDDAAKGPSMRNQRRINKVL